MGRKTRREPKEITKPERHVYPDTTGGGETQVKAEQQKGGSLNQAPPRRSVLTSTAHAVGQAWMYITDEAAAVAAEGPEGLEKAAQYHQPMPKPHLQFNITSEGQNHSLQMQYLPDMLL